MKTTMPLGTLNKYVLPATYYVDIGMSTNVDIGETIVITPSGEQMGLIQLMSAQPGQYPQVFPDNRFRTNTHWWVDYAFRFETYEAPRLNATLAAELLQWKIKFTDAGNKYQAAQDKAVVMQVVAIGIAALGYFGVLSSLQTAIARFALNPTPLNFAKAIFQIDFGDLFSFDSLSNSFADVGDAGSLGDTAMDVDNWDVGVIGDTGSLGLDYLNTIGDLPIVETTSFMDDFGNITFDVPSIDVDNWDTSVIGDTGSLGLDNLPDFADLPTVEITSTWDGTDIDFLDPVVIDTSPIEPLPEYGGDLSSGIDTSGFDPNSNFGGDGAGSGYLPTQGSGGLIPRSGGTALPDNPWGLVGMALQLYANYRNAQLTQDARDGSRGTIRGANGATLPVRVDTRTGQVMTDANGRPVIDGTRISNPPPTRTGTVPTAMVRDPSGNPVRVVVGRDGQPLRDFSGNAVIAPSASPVVMLQPDGTPVVDSQGRPVFTTQSSSLSNKTPLIIGVGLGVAALLLLRKK